MQDCWASPYEVAILLEIGNGHFLTGAMKLLGHCSTSTSSTPVALSPSRRPCGKMSLISCSLKSSSSSKPVIACDLVPATRAENHTKRAEAPKHRQGLSDQLKSSLTLHKLLRMARISPILVNGDVNVLITGIQHDSRLVTPGDVFVCCRGFSSDGHVHAAHAIQRGAAAIIGTMRTPLPDVSVTFIQVKDTNSILSALSAAFYGHPSNKLTVVGVTGTNGKTTTSYLVKSVFEAMNMQTGLLGTIAYDINDGRKIIASNTTPDALSLQCLMAAMVSNNATVCVMEVSSHALALGRCNAVDFDIAVFTNLTRDHMDFHKTEQNYMEAKGLLFAKMLNPLQQRKVVNLDDPHATYFVKQGSPSVPLVRFSLDKRDADVFASNVELSLLKTDFVAHTRMGKIHITSKLLGRHNIYNILAAVAIGVAAEIPLDVIVAGVEAVHAVPGRCELIKEGQNFAVLVDYAHTPDALARLLDMVEECGAKQIITVIGCGGDRDRGKRPVMARTAADKSDICILTSDNPRTENPLSILDDMLSGLGLSMEEYMEEKGKDGQCVLNNAHRLVVCENRQLAIRMAISMGKDGDAVVVAGKGHEAYQIVGSRKEHFDDRDECRRMIHDLHVAITDAQPNLG